VNPGEVWPPVHDIDWAGAAVADLGAAGYPRVWVVLTRCRACGVPLLLFESDRDLLIVELPVGYPPD